MRLHFKIISFLILVFLLNSCKKDLEINLIEYYINSDIKDTQFKTFIINDSIDKKVLLKQSIYDASNQDEVIMEYYFMTSDSLPYSGGIEKISTNEVEFLEKYIWMDDDKISAEKNEDNKWNPNKDRMPSANFINKRTGFEIKSSNTCNPKLIDSLGTSYLVVEFDVETEFLQDGSVFSRDNFTYKSIYKKDKGLVYFEESYGKEVNKYRLID